MYLENIFDDVVEGLKNFKASDKVEQYTLVTPLKGPMKKKGEVCFPGKN